MRKHFDRKKQAALFRKSDKLWQVMRIALIDLAWAEKSRNYNVNMNNWHYKPENERCKVCFAGAVMAHTLGCKRNENKSPSSLEGDDAVTQKMYALNLLRSGYVAEAYKALHNTMVVPDYVRECNNSMIDDYHENREQWWKEMRTLASQLKKLNI